EEVIEAHFPELIASLLEPISVHKGISEVAEYSLTYSLNNPVIVSEFLRSQEDIKVEAWEVEKQEFTWSGTGVSIQILLALEMYNLRMHMAHFSCKKIH